MPKDEMPWWTPADRLAYCRRDMEKRAEAARAYNLQPSPGVLERLEIEIDRLTGVIRG